MRGKCPICRKDTFSEYLGVIVYGENYKFFQCNHGKVSGQEKTYFRESKHRKDILTIYEDEMHDMLRSRIQCPLCKRDDGKIPIRCREGKDYKYKFVVSKGNSNRFYCKNHPDKKHNRYEFRVITKKISMTLKKLLTKISSELFSRIDDVYHIEEVYDFRKDEDHLLEFFFSINLSHNLLAAIFHTSQPTIFRLSEKKNVPYITKVNTLKRDKSRLFYSRVNLTTEDFENIKDMISYVDGKIYFDYDLE